MSPEGVPIGLYRSSVSGQFLEVNQALADLWGFSDRKSMLAAKIEDLYADPEDRQRWIDLISRAEFVRNFQVRVRRVDGSIVWIEDTARAVRDAAGRVLYYEGAVVDITERKQLEQEIKRLNEELEQRVKRRTEQLQAANRELEAFSYSVSHDLRAPLRAITGFSRILVEDYSEPLDNEGKRLLNAIRASASFMGQLIEDLLDFARVSRQTITLADIDMNELVLGLSKQAREANPGRQLAIRLNALAPARGDPVLVRQILANLIENAVKFTQFTATPEIDIGCHPAPDLATYYVRDNGVGFDMKYTEKLFGVFQRLHPAAEFEGTGVGLAIVQRIVSRHGGRIWAEGKANGGATFYFTLPRQGTDVE